MGHNRALFSFPKIVKVIQHTSGGRSLSGGKCNAKISRVSVAQVMGVLASASSVKYSSLSSYSGRTLISWNSTSRMGCASLCFTTACRQTL